MATTLPKMVGEQCRVLYLPENQNQVILGVAGSGKSIEAVYRALWLSQAHPDEKVLLLTVNGEVNNHLKMMLDSVDHGDNIEVATVYGYFKKLVNDYLPQNGQFQNWLSEYRQFRQQVSSDTTLLVATTKDEEKKVVGELCAQARIRNPQSNLWRKDNADSIVLNEIIELQQNAVDSLDQYLKMTRISQDSQMLSQEDKGIIYEIFNDYPRARRNKCKKLFDFNDIYQVVANSCNIPEDAGPKYVIVDEAQDLSPAMFEGLKSVLPNDCVWTAFGDLYQNIFGEGSSCISTLKEETKPYRMQKNYRNTEQIGLVAKAMLDTDLFPKDANDNEPSLNVFTGSKPLLWHLTKENQDYLVRQVRALAQAGSTAVIFMNPGGKLPGLSENQSEESQMKDKLSEIGVSVINKFAKMQPGTVYMGTINRIKGLEFDSVVVYCIDDYQPVLSMEDKLPNGDLTPQLSKESQAKLARSVYVATTRAKKNLTLVYRNNPLPFLIPNSDLVKVVK